MRIFFIIFFFLIAKLSVFAQDNTAKENHDSIPWSYQVDKPPEFPDGESAFIFFIGKNTNLPDTLKCYISKIYLSFIVDEKGKIQNTEIKIPESRIHCTNINYSTIAKTKFIEKLTAALKNVPDWTPAKQGAKNVSVRMLFPINIDM